jgi:hypothetical protein
MRAVSKVPGTGSEYSRNREPQLCTPPPRPPREFGFQVGIREHEFFSLLDPLLRQAIDIYPTVVVGNIYLASVDHRRIKFVEQKLDVPSLRVP